MTIGSYFILVLDELDVNGSLNGDLGTVEKGTWYMHYHFALQRVAHTLSPYNSVKTIGPNLGKMKPSTSKKHTRSSRLPLSKQYSNSKSESMLYAEKTRLFQALLGGPLSFLDLHVRFNVSRQTIARLVKRGLPAETWEIEGVGATFKPTSKGKACLKELEDASKYEPRIRENSLISLKQRSVV